MKQEEGVSPVIATILMVAITVVLAATLYVMIAGNLLGTPYSNAKLVGSLTENYQKSTGKKVIFTITMSEPEKTGYSNVKITIINNSTLATLNYQSGEIWSNATASGKWHYEAKLQDSDGNGEFSDGDVLIVYVVDDNPLDSVTPPSFHTGEQVVFSITGYHGVSSNGKIQL